MYDMPIQHFPTTTDVRYANSTFFNYNRCNIRSWRCPYFIHLSHAVNLFHSVGLEYMNSRHVRTWSLLVV